jgi:DNA-binding NtrC family response regulator
MSLPPTPTTAMPTIENNASVDVRVPFKVAKEALVESFERAYLRGVLAACNGNMTRAAKMAGLDRMYLHRLVQKHGSRAELTSGTPPPPPTSGERS